MSDPPGWTRFVPGLAHLLRGRAAVGLALLVPWVTGLLLAWLRRHRLPGSEAWIRADVPAVTALVAMVVVPWGLSLMTGRGASPAGTGEGAGPMRLALRSLARRPGPVLGMWVLGGFVVAALLAPLLAPADPSALGSLATERFLSPSGASLLGTDRLGRDVLSRLLYGARISLTVGLLAVLMSALIGTLVGAVSGFVGGVTDSVLMRLVDMVLAFPRLVLLLAIVALLDPSVGVIIVVLGLTQWPATARLVRGEVLSLREREFILAARALGFSRRRIVLRHLVPNALGPVLVTATLGIGQTIVLEAGLSFLGVGVPLGTPSWGGMLAEGRGEMMRAWWLSVFPGLAIVLTVLAFNLVGQGLRDALDPRGRWRTP